MGLVSRPVNIPGAPMEVLQRTTKNLRLCTADLRDRSAGARNVSQEVELRLENLCSYERTLMEQNGGNLALIRID